MQAVAQLRQDDPSLEAPRRIKESFKNQRPKFTRRHKPKLFQAATTIKSKQMSIENMPQDKLLSHIRVPYCFQESGELLSFTSILRILRYKWLLNLVLKTSDLIRSLVHLKNELGAT